ncbi:MAG: energy transducer TonB [Candidatus Zixiibacteriota bacterium]
MKNLLTYPLAAGLLIIAILSTSHAAMAIVLPGPPSLFDGPAVTPATAVHQPSPSYPPEALKQELEGTVWVKGLVGIEGDISDLEVVTTDCESCGFEEAALDAAKLYQFEPAHCGSEPVASWVSLKIEFRLP